MKTKTGTHPRHLRNVATLALDASKCVGCGRCVQVCPHGVFEEGRPVRIADRDACMECGACMTNCPAGALQVDKGVGCAYAFIMGALLGTEPTCGCGSDEDAGGGGCC